MSKKVFSVIVTYNGAHWVDKCIVSLLESNYPISIIVIDNFSTDNTVSLLQKYDKVDLIQSAINLGFGKANNIGIKKALEQGADYVFLLNQDAWVFDNTITSIVSKMDKNPQLGILSPQHYSGNDIDYDIAFATYLSRKTDTLKDLNVALMPFVNAAAWMLSRSCVEKVGYFESLFSHYGEDRNYCNRVTYHGFLIGVDLDSKIIHDRVITRSFKKDTIQSKYKVLTTFLNINNSLFKSCVLALKEVVGLPKYFLKFYSFSNTAYLFLLLLKYYLGFIFRLNRLIEIRKITVK